MSSTPDYSHLVHIETPEELVHYDLIPNVVWFFDLDKHGWWWGNQAAVSFWGLDDVQQLIDKDLSGDTEGARERTQQTFDLAVKDGLTVDPWTTYPGDKPKTVLMMHRAVTLGPDRHRGIIAFINDQVDLGEQPENLLLVESMRYTRVPATTFTLDGVPVIENPAATEAYKYLNDMALPDDLPPFVARFADPKEGWECLKKAQTEEGGGRWDYMMRTGSGIRRHSLDICRTRHPLTGDFLFLMVEYDVTRLYDALDEVEAARARLHNIAMKDTLTGAHSLHYMQEAALSAISKAIRHDDDLRVMFIDLDGFKGVNDGFGHEAGDEVLCKAVQLIQAEIRQGDLLARIGGDEFVIMQPRARNKEDTASMVQRILAKLSSPIAVTGGTVTIGASIGIATCPQHGDNLEDLLKVADRAMYDVKKSGKNGFAFAD